MDMAKLQLASKSKYLLASTALLLGTTIWSGLALAQAQTQAQSSQFGGGGFGRGGGGSGSALAQAQPTQFGGGGFGRGGGGGGGGTGTGSGGDPATDPGVRGGPAGAGGPLPNLTPAELAFFNAAAVRFENVDAVANGLGPGFNLNSCSGCHAQPATGGTSPATNPEVAVATLNGAKNVIPSFVTASGPVREARFVLNSSGTPDGGVHDLFTITGRSDAQGCNLAQPNFAAAIAANNIIFRIPTPTFGLGLVENVSDSGLQTAFQSTAQQKASLGISGNFNTSGNTGNITRFGWKAQNPSLLVFSAEAYNVEMGVTNDGFPEKRNNPPTSCQLNPLPEDTTNLTAPTPSSGSQASDFSSDIVNFAAFMRMLAPPTPASGTPPVAQTSSTTTASTATSSSAAPVEVATADPTSVLSAAAGTSSGSTATTPSTTSTGSTASITRGQQVFANIGCQACHLTNQTTGNSEIGTAATNVTFHPLSDFALHNMGSGLADGVSQGAATGNQFRTAPLWGVGQRIFFLHDGRTTDLMVAIEQHASSGSEANTVISNFNTLGVSDQQALLNYLRSL
jgi:CxxC motif-containing protein (DUF1111 family)